MLYIIGGVPRSGKSLIAQKMLTEKSISYLPTDALIGAFKRGNPDLNINHDLPFIEKADKAWIFLEPLFKNLILEKNYLVEGDCIPPNRVNEFKEKRKENVRVCFLGYTELNSQKKLSFIREHHQGDTDWTRKHSDEAMIEMIERMIIYSTFLKLECKKYNIRFFDVSNNFEKVHKEIFEYLIS